MSDTPPDFIPFWFFAVASYDVGVRRYHDKDAADMPPDGLFRTLDLYCASDNPTQITAFIWFGTHDIDNSGPGTVGTAYGVGTDSIDVAVSFPLDEYELWLELLTGDRQVSFEFFVNDDTSADGETTVTSVALTTEQEARPRSTHSIPANLRRRVMT